MATQSPLLPISVFAGADLSAQQYRCVKLNTSTGKAVVAGAGEAILGVLQQPRVADQEVTVEVAGTTKVVAGNTVTPGIQLEVGTDGRVIPLNTGILVGYAITGGSANQIIEMLIK